MQLDPSRWLVSFAGFTYDWIITREWKFILFSSIPVVLLVSAVAFVWWGRTMDRRALASWYMELGEAEIAEWEDSWVGGVRDQGSDESDDQAASSETSSNALAADDSSKNEPESQADSDSAVDEPRKEDSEADGPKEISPYADMLFRKVQELAPSDRSQFFIAASLAQRGLIEQAKEMLQKIAPEEGSGNAAAHAYLAWILLQEFGQSQSEEKLASLRHHLEEAANATRVPVDVLVAASNLRWVTGINSSSDFYRRRELGESIKLLQRAAELDPSLHLELAKRAKSVDNNLVADSAISKGEKHYRERLEQNEKDEDARVALAELLIRRQMVDEAQQLLMDGLALNNSDKIKRAISEVYRYRFLDSIQKNQGLYSSNVSMLDMAMRYDPTNPKVAEEVAKLARFQLGQASNEMIAKLQEFLAQGKATTLTHAWLAEAYLVRNNFEKALPQLEQVVMKLPNMTSALNNLAYVLAEMHPERLEEALVYSQRAVEASRSEPNPDYYDTMAIVFSKLNRSTEAIAAFETAIELAPERKDFHQRVADEYRKRGDENMALNHEKMITMLLEKEQAAAQDAQAAEATPGETSAPRPELSEPTASEPTASEPTASEPTASEPTASEPNHSENEDSPDSSAEAAGESQSPDGSDASDKAL